MVQAWRWIEYIFHWIESSHIDILSCNGDCKLWSIFCLRWRRNEIGENIVFSATVGPAVTPLFLTRVSQRKETNWDGGLPFLIVLQENYPLCRPGLAFKDFPWHSLVPQFSYATDELSTLSCKFMGRQNEWQYWYLGREERQINEQSHTHDQPDSSWSTMQDFCKISGHARSSSLAATTFTTICHLYWVISQCVLVSWLSGDWHRFYLETMRTWVSDTWKGFLETYIIY